jgi:hypothetical protein
MNKKSLLLTGLCAAILLTGFDASARYGRSRYRPPPPQQKPQPPPKPVPPKILSVSGTLYSLNAPGKSLMIQDDNAKSMLNLVVTPQTKFIRGGQTVPPAGIKTYEHVSVTYQDTDSTAKEVRVTPASGTPAPKTGKTGKPKTKK